MFTIIVALLILSFVGSVQIRTLRSENARITSLYNTEKAYNAASSGLQETNKATVERLQSSCQEQIKAAVAKVESAVPVCPDNQKPVYKAKGLIK